MSVTFTALFVPAGETRAFPVDHLEEINLCDGNAGLVLDLLGLIDRSDPEAELAGQVPVAEFAERVAVAEATDPGSARAGFDDGRWHEIGASADYLRGRLAQLAELARATREFPGAVLAWA